MPDAKKARFIGDFGLSDYDASVLTADVTASAFFEEVAATAKDGKLAANWVINELFGRLKKDEREISDSPVSPAQLAGIIALINCTSVCVCVCKNVCMYVCACKCVCEFVCVLCDV